MRLVMKANFTNANIQKLRSWVGVVTENTCGVAEFVRMVSS